MRLITEIQRRRRAAGGLLCLLLGGGIAGCDSFVTTEPRAQLTTENFFRTPSHAEEATNATYNALRMWEVHVFAWIGMTDIVSDDATKGSVPADADFLGALNDLLFDPGNTAFLGTWTGYYRGIYRANLAIENIPRIEMNETARERLIGENKFLRAYYYFFLVRAYGGVPLITTQLRPGELTQPRASVEEVYALIKQDLTDAIAVLPQQYGAADMGRATSGAARALLAQVHLFEGDYESAYQRATEVINSSVYGLYPSYAGIFTPAGENSSESVFEVQAIALEQGGAGSQYSQVQGVRGVPNLGWGFNTPSEHLEAAYEPGDPRLQATIMYPWEQLPDGSNFVVYLNPSMPNNRYNQKPFIPVDNPQGSGNGGSNIRRIRYADVLLMAAEAAYRTNRQAEAQTLLNQVRQRARGGRTVTLGFTPEQLFEPIASEVIGLAPGASRVFARYVNPANPAHAAGLRSFDGECGGPNNTCPQSAVPPVRVAHADIIQAVDGTPVTTLASYFAALETKAPGSNVTLHVLRVRQPENGNTETQEIDVTVPVQQLLPPVTATGDALLEAIWHERRVELAMEQHRWFDLVRQGRAAEVMAAAGQTFQTGVHERYPIPLAEVQVAGLQQNPGY